MGIVCNCLVFVLFLAFTSPYIRATTFHTSFNTSYIEKLSLNTCVLIIYTGEDALGVTDALNKEVVNVFKEEDAIEIILLSIEQAEEEPASSIVLYPKRTVDRTCLTFPDLPIGTGKPFLDKLTISGVVKFINKNCNTFRSVSGGLTPPGILKEQIMHNMFELQKSGSKCTRIRGSLSESDFFWEYLSRSQPVVIEGGAQHWPAMSKWTSEYLRQKYRDKEVHIKLTEKGEFEGVEDAQLWPGYSWDRIPEIVRNKLPFPDLVVVRPATAEMKFSEFIDLISMGLNQSGISAYLEYSSIPYYMPELEVDIVEPFGNILERKHLNMWLSDGHTLGKLHFDPFDNFLCQISGEKELVLFQPRDNENLYESHIPEALLGYDKKRRKIYRHSLLESTSMVMSPIDILNPNLERFPKFAQVKAMECTIRPGDILFMPAFWWHEVKSTPDTEQHRNLAVNFWYEPLLTKEFPCPDCKLQFNPLYYNNLLHNPPQ